MLVGRRGGKRGGVNHDLNYERKKNVLSEDKKN
jgi:hypothetical protein